MRLKKEGKKEDCLVLVVEQPSDLTGCVVITTWERRTYVAKLEDWRGRSIKELKVCLGRIERTPPAELRFVSRLAEASLPWEKLELQDDEVIVDKPLMLRASCPPLMGGALRGGTCPVLGRDVNDLGSTDRSPWGRHVPLSLPHLWTLRLHGRTALLVWAMLLLLYFSEKGSWYHVLLGRTLYFSVLPVMLYTGVDLFFNLFRRKNQFQNIMKSDGTITIFVFGVECILVFAETVLIPSLRYRFPEHGRTMVALSTVLHLSAATLVLAGARILYMRSRSRWALVRRGTDATRVDDLAFENGIELLILVVPMISVNLVNLALLQLTPTSCWSWVLHHKVNAILLGYIFLPGSTLPIGRDAFWLFSWASDTIGGLHNVRDRILIENLPIVLYFICGFRQLAAWGVLNTSSC